MAWASTQEEALYKVGQHMGILPMEKKKELSDLYRRLIFPDLGWSWQETMWTTRGAITIVTMWDDDHLLRNIRLAMIKEQMLMGPKRYCVLMNWMPDLESRMLLLMNYLPHQKMFLHPNFELIRGPFLRSPWLEIARGMAARGLKKGNQVLNDVYYDQQCEIARHTNTFRPFARITF